MKLNYKNDFHGRLAYGSFSFLMFFILSLFFAQASVANSARELEGEVNEALNRFYSQVSGSQDFLKGAKGVLVLPTVIKAGFGFGGEYGEGALRIQGKTAEYYSMAAASFGFQIGAQAKTVILVFLDAGALNLFRNSGGWKAGVDGSVALVAVGAGQSLSTANIKDPIVGFVIGQKGLMYNLTLEGSKFTKIDLK